MSVIIIINMHELPSIFDDDIQVLFDEHRWTMPTIL